MPNRVRTLCSDSDSIRNYEEFIRNYQVLQIPQLCFIFSRKTYKTSQTENKMCSLICLTIYNTIRHHVGLLPCPGYNFFMFLYMFLFQQVCQPKCLWTDLPTTKFANMSFFFNLGDLFSIFSLNDGIVHLI